MIKPYGYVRKDGNGVFIYGEHQFQNPQDYDLIPIYTEDTLQKLIDDEREACAKVADLVAREVDATYIAVAIRARGHT